MCRVKHTYMLVNYTTAKNANPDDIHNLLPVVYKNAPSSKTKKIKLLIL